FTTLLGQKIRTLHGSTLSDRSIDASTAVRAGEDVLLFSLRIPRPVILATAAKHDLALRFCYCSINERCWNLFASTRSPAPAVPAPVAACVHNYAIAAP